VNRTLLDAARRGFPDPVLLAGLCPVVAPAQGPLAGLAMGAAAALVLVASAITIHATRRLVMPEVRFPALLVVTAAWVTVADLVMQASMFQLRLTLAFYVPLLAMNCLLLSALEEEAFRDGSREAFIRLLWLALAVFGWAGAVGAVRGLLGPHLPVFTAAPGAFLALSLLAAAGVAILAVRRRPPAELP
jgi:electron transport complex protein RnfE